MVLGLWFRVGGPKWWLFDFDCFIRCFWTSGFSVVCLRLIGQWQVAQQSAPCQTSKLFLVDKVVTGKSGLCCEWRYCMLVYAMLTMSKFLQIKINNVLSLSSPASFFIILQYYHVLSLIIKIIIGCQLILLVLFF